MIYRKQMQGMTGMRQKTVRTHSYVNEKSKTQPEPTKPLRQKHCAK